MFWGESGGHFLRDKIVLVHILNSCSSEHLFPLHLSKYLTPSLHRHPGSLGTSTGRTQHTACLTCHLKVVILTHSKTLVSDGTGEEDTRWHGVPVSLHYRTPGIWNLKPLDTSQSSACVAVFLRGWNCQLKYSGVTSLNTEMPFHPEERSVTSLLPRDRQ